MTLGMWIAAAVVGWCAAALAVAFLVAAVIRLRDQQTPNNATIEELLEGDDVNRPVGGTGVGGTAPKPPAPPSPKPPAVNR